MQVAYRFANIGDLDEIFTLVTNAINVMERQNIYQWDKLYPTIEYFKKDIENNHLYVGTVSNQIAVVFALNQNFDAGYKHGSWLHPDKSYYVVHRLCVNPAFQNKGVGKQTIEYIEKKLKAINIDAIRLDAFSKNPYSLKMYSKAGFSIVGNVNWRKGKFFLLEKYI